MNRLLTVCAAVFLSTITFSQTNIRQVKPSDTDPTIATFNTDSHYVYLNPGVQPLNLLVVHLPGSFGEPKRATLFGTLAADLGFHSIGLMYPNVPTVGSFCTNSSDTSCFEHVRREIVEGADYSSALQIDAGEGILNRVKKLLQYLRDTYPSENWQQFLGNQDELMYQKIIFSGHSQGGGHAALIARYYPIQRALCFSSPKDWSNFYDSPPAWLSSGNWLTPPQNIYAFNHVLDEHVRQLEIWDSLNLDLSGLPVNVDSSASPYGFTRQLTTSFAVPAGDEHASTIQDNKTPKSAGVPLFAPVWTYMLLHNMSVDVPFITNHKASALMLVPNPATDRVTINLTLAPCKLRVYYHTGQLAASADYSEPGIKTIDLSSLSTGLYFVQVISPSETYTSALLLE